MNISFVFKLTVLINLGISIWTQTVKKEEGTSLIALMIAKLECVLSCDVET